MYGTAGIPTQTYLAAGEAVKLGGTRAVTPERLVTAVKAIAV